MDKFSILLFLYIVNGKYSSNFSENDIYTEEHLPKVKTRRVDGKWSITSYGASLNQMNLFNKHRWDGKKKKTFKIFVNFNFLQKVNYLFFIITLCTKPFISITRRDITSTTVRRYQRLSAKNYSLSGIYFVEVQNKSCNIINFIIKLKQLIIHLYNLSIINWMRIPYPDT